MLMQGFSQALLCRKIYEFCMMLIYPCTTGYVVSNFFISVFSLSLDELVKINILVVLMFVPPPEFY